MQWPRGLFKDCLYYNDSLLDAHRIELVRLPWSSYSILSKLTESNKIHVDCVWQKISEILYEKKSIRQLKGFPFFVDSLLLSIANLFKINCPANQPTIGWYSRYLFRWSSFVISTNFGLKWPDWRIWPNLVIWPRDYPNILWDSLSILSSSFSSYGEWFRDLFIWIDCSLL